MNQFTELASDSEAVYRSVIMRAAGGEAIDNSEIIAAAASIERSPRHAEADLERAVSRISKVASHDPTSLANAVTAAESMASTANTTETQALSDLEAAKQSVLDAKAALLTAQGQVKDGRLAVSNAKALQRKALEDFDFFMLNTGSGPDYLEPQNFSLKT